MPGLNDPTLFPKESLDAFIEEEPATTSAAPDEVVEEDVQSDIESKILDVDIEDMIKKATAHEDYKTALTLWNKLPADKKKTTPKPTSPEGKAVFPSEKGKIETGVAKLKGLHGGIFKGFKDEHGKSITELDLRKLLTQKPDNLIGANSKLKKSGVGQKFYDLTMPAYKGLYYDEKLHQWKVIVTCPFAGVCKKWCYAMKGGYIQYKASSINSTRAINFLMNHFDEFKAKLESELATETKINNKKNIQTVLRWHDAGDFMSPSYLLMAYDVARGTPDITHYAYTKNIPLVRKLAKEKPDNFIFNFSFGGALDIDASESDKRIAPEGEELFYKEIDPTSEKYSRVVPKELFIKIPHHFLTTKLNAFQISKYKAQAKASYDKAMEKYINRDKTKSKMKEPAIKEIKDTAIVGISFDDVYPDGSPKAGKTGIKDLKDVISEYYKLPLDSIVTYDELKKIPYDRNAKTYNKIYNVLVWKGNGDDAATRKDIKGTFLFFH